MASVKERVNERGDRSISIKQYDRLRALMLLARISGLLINRTEVSGPGDGPAEVKHTDFRERITRRLAEIAERLSAPTEQPIIDVTPARQASPVVLLAPRLRDEGERE